MNVLFLIEMQNFQHTKFLQDVEWKQNLDKYPLINGEITPNFGSSKKNPIILNTFLVFGMFLLFDALILLIYIFYYHDENLPQRKNSIFPEDDDNTELNQSLIFSSI